MRYTILKTPEYQDWLDSETKKSKVQIEERISKIETDGHFGTRKELDDELWELKSQWKTRLLHLYT